jgi:hypothetical protein
MKMSAWRVSWRAADLVRRRSLYVGGCSSANRPGNREPPASGVPSGAMATVVDAAMAAVLVTVILVSGYLRFAKNSSAAV